MDSTRAINAYKSTWDSTFDVVVSLGTDTHRFNRLMDWIDSYLQMRPDVTCLIQHGFSRPSSLATSILRMPRPELLEHYRNASAVVVQGGPGSILDARSLGVMPLVVPRRAELCEAVDNHQVVFTDHMMAAREALQAYTFAELSELLDTAIARPSVFRTSPRTAQPELAARALEVSLSRSMSTPWRVRNLTHRLRPAMRDIVSQMLPQ